MGYYINAPDERLYGKCEWLMENHNAVEISIHKALQILESQDTDMGVICVVLNPAFEAAAFCFNKQEFQCFTYPHDNRPKRWFSMNREQAKKLSGYNN